MTKKRALLIVGLALLLAAAGVVYAHWQDSLRMEVDVSTGTIDPQWSLTGTNDDGVGWPDEPVPSEVFTYGAATSNDPSAPAGGGNIITVTSSNLNYSNTGWGGWSCPSDHPFIVSGSWLPASFVMEESHLWKPGAATISPVVNYPATPFGYTYGSGEQGFIAQAGGVGGTVQLVLQCSDAAAGPRYDKDVADCFAELHSDTAGDTNDYLHVTIDNAYPSYWCTVKADLHNVGTVPVKLQSIALTDGLGEVIQYQIDDADGALECGYQLEPGEPVDIYLSFHPLNAAEQETDYSFDMDLGWVNYNEYDAANCPSAPAPVQKLYSQWGPLNFNDAGGGAGWTAVGGVCPAGTALIGGGLDQDQAGTPAPCAYNTVFMTPSTVYPWYTTGVNESGIGATDVGGDGCANTGVWLYALCQ